MFLSLGMMINSS